MQSLLFYKKSEEFNSEKSKFRKEKDLYLSELSKLRKTSLGRNNKDLNLKATNDKLRKSIMRFHLKNNQLKESLNAKITTLELIKKETENLLKFVPLSNKINRINKTFTCCENRCINSDISGGSCFSGNGFVNVNGSKLKYHKGKSLESNNWIRLYAKHSFKGHSGYYYVHSLFYFEVKIKREAGRNVYVGIGFEDIDAKMLCNGSGCLVDHQKFNWKDGDVFGCGVVFPPKNDSETLPYMFFTKNGGRLGKNIMLTEYDDILIPFVGLLSSSVEVNFGNNLVSNPFRFNVSK